MLQKTSMRPPLICPVTLIPLLPDRTWLANFADGSDWIERARAPPHGRQLAHARTHLSSYSQKEYFA